MGGTKDATDVPQFTAHRPTCSSLTSLFPTSERIRECIIPFSKKLVDVDHPRSSPCPSYLTLSPSSAQTSCWSRLRLSFFILTLPRHPLRAGLLSILPPDLSLRSLPPRTSNQTHTSKDVQHCNTSYNPRRKTPAVFRTSPSDHQTTFHIHLSW